ncbi:hypothetical protein HDU99_010720 [Rhizoclosmatium hyalinum]|nr:hypothetical protein HDU99_010720 [Rhizoclosmatium hyalinum]
MTSKRMSLAQVFAGNQTQAVLAPTTTSGRRTSTDSQGRSNTITPFGFSGLGGVEETEDYDDVEIDPQEYETTVLNATKILPGRGGAIQLIRSIDPNQSSSRKPSNIEIEEENPSSTLTVDSEVSDFRTFHDDMAHPANVLMLVADENDRRIYTEFDNICNELLSNLGDFEAALEELTLWKDDFMTQSVPSTIKLQLTMLFTRLFRSKSIMHEPTFELIRQVRLYSRPWMNKRQALLELEKDYQRQSHVLDVAIRKLEQLQLQIQKLRSDKKLLLWERLCHKIFAVYIDDLNNEDEQTDPEPQPTTVKATSRQSQHYPPGVAKPQLLHGNSQHLDRTRSRTISHASRSPSRRNSPHGSSRSVHGSNMNVKTEIKSYISDKRPAWFKKAKTRVNQFTTVLLKHHPRYQEKLTRLHRYPFCKRDQLFKYVSQRSDTLILRKLRKPNMPRSWSLIDMREFNGKGIRIGTGKNGSGNVLADPELAAQVARDKFSLVRSNSFNLFSELHFSSLKYPEVLLGINMQDIGQDFQQDPMRSKVVSDDELDEEYQEDPDDWLSDVNYFGDFDSEMVDDMIDKYMNPHTKEKSELPTEGDILNPTEGDADKDTFSMQDVMELTLLHAQQMHLMQKEYEDRIRQQDIQMEVMKQTLADADAAYEERMKQANERAQRLAQKYMTHRGSTENTAKAAEGTHGGKGGGGRGGAHDDGNSSESEDGGKKKKDGVEKKKKGISKESKEAKSRLYNKEVKVPVVKPVIKLQSHEHTVKKKVFTSAPFSMNFMERLRWFTEERLKKMRELEDKFRTQEINANEERLNQLKLIRRHKGVIEDSAYRDAEFVPYPGTIPVHKMRKAWTEQGVTLPWDGRFKSMKKWENKPNVLNLFDIALRTIPSASMDARKQANETPKAEIEEGLGMEAKPIQEEEEPEYDDTPVFLLERSEESAQ